ncbi:MAG TPA: NAD(P)-binding domain-containing protein [Acetobacteraceae bacterium]
MKVGIIGAGAVGRACLLALTMRGPADEIVVVDRTPERAEGEIADIRYGAILSQSVRLRDGDYEELRGAGLVMITIGLNEKSGGATDRNDKQGRLRLLQKNAEIYRGIVPLIVDAAPGAVLLVVTDPPDPLAFLTRQLVRHERVVSTGTLLDSLRFRFHLAERLQVDPRSVEAQVLGEHGTSAVFLWSGVRVGGVTLDKIDGGGEAAMRGEIEKTVRAANITIIEGIGASQLGIGVLCARLAEMVARDERAVVPVGSFNENYGVTLSLPSVVGREGVLRVFEPAMTEKEAAALRESAAVLRGAQEGLGG